MDYKNNWLGKLMNVTSQWANVFFCNGNSDISISARIGYNNYFYNRWFYKLCAWIVDNTFYPVDGKDHCKDAYLNDRNEDYGIGGGWFLGEVFTIVLLIIFCITLAILFWSYYFLKKLVNKLSTQTQ